jgi:hypothetical protein
VTTNATGRTGDRSGRIDLADAALHAPQTAFGGEDFWLWLAHCLGILVPALLTGGNGSLVKGKR